VRYVGLIFFGIDFRGGKMEKKTIETSLAEWKEKGIAEKFERLIALLLSVAVSIVVVLSVIRVFAALASVVLTGADPLGYDLFRNVFGMIMVVLIALEFNHIIIQIIHGVHALAQLRMVVAIAILAVVRKFVILDITVTPPETIFALAAVALALGVVFWLIRAKSPDQD